MFAERGKGSVMADAQADAPAAAARPGLRIRSDVLIAIIGLVGVVFTGMVSNWDKIFHADSVISERANYTPAGDFESELRVYMEKSGTRAQMEDLQGRLLDAMQQQMTTQDPADAAKIVRLIAEVKKVQPSFEDILKRLLPIYQKYYTIDEIRALNKFYSTPTMQSMIAKNPLIARDTQPILQQVMQEQQVKAQEIVQRFVAEEAAQAAAANPPLMQQQPQQPETVP
jgi:hypothetical protein